MSHCFHQRCVLAALALAADIAPTASLAQQTEEVITLYNFPAEMVKLDTSSAGWSAPSYSSNGVPAVSRKALPLQTCGRPADIIDLARVRANGFRLVDTHVNGNFGPEGYKMTGESVVRLYQRNGTRLTNAPKAAETDVISISPSVWALDIPVRGKLQRLGCSATWGLVIRVVGPKGVDPYRKVAPIARAPVGSRSMKEIRR